MLGQFENPAADASVFLGELTLDFTEDVPCLLSGDRSFVKDPYLRGVEIDGDHGIREISR